MREDQNLNEAILRNLGSSKNLVEQHASKKYKLQALELSLRTTQRLYMCQSKHFGMRLRRINRPKAALITEKQRHLIVVEKREAAVARATTFGVSNRLDQAALSTKYSEEPMFSWL